MRMSMSSTGPWAFLLGCVVCAGCGGDASNSSGQAGNAVPGNPGGAAGMATPGMPMPGMHGGAAAMAGPGMATPGMPMPGMPTPGAPAGGAPADAQAASGRKSISELQKFIPPSLTQAAGAQIGTLKKQTSELAKQMLASFEPVLMVLRRAGLDESKIDLVIAASDRKSDSVLICASMTGPIKEADVVKALNAAEKPEKIGKANVYKLAAAGSHQNSVAFIDGQVLLVGRQKILEEALKNPKAGAVRAGLDTLNLPQTLYFVAGDNLGRLTDKEDGLIGLAALADSRSTQIVGTAFGILSGTDPNAGSAPGMMAGGPPAMHGPPNMHASPAGPPMHTPMPMPGAMPMPGNPMPWMQPSPGSTGSAGGTGELTGNVTITLGVAFASEQAATVAEEKVTNLRKMIATLIQAQQQLYGQGNQNGATPGSPMGPMGPMGPMPGGHTPPRSVREPSSSKTLRLESETRLSPAIEHLLWTVGAAAQTWGDALEFVGPESPTSDDAATLVQSRLKSHRGPGLVQTILSANIVLPPAPAAGDHSADQRVEEVTTFAQQPPPMGHTPPGPGMGPMGAMPGSPGANGNGNSQFVLDPRLQLSAAFNLSRDKTSLRLTASLDSKLLSEQLGRLGDAIGAAGAATIDDGIYPGTLTALHQPYVSFMADGSKKDLQKGVRRIGELPLRSGYSWMTEMLPYIGRDDLYLRFDFTKSWRSKDNIELTNAIVSQFLNPADPQRRLTGFPYEGMGVTHFVGMAGVEDSRNDVAASLPRTDPRAGVFGYDEVMRPEQITDGQNNTILMIGSGKVSGAWVAAGGATVRGARQPYFDSMTGFGSVGIPGGGAYVLMADGSTRVIAANIDPAIFRALCTAHGAEMVDLSKAFEAAK